jgi:hypothetical protein
MSCSRAAMVRLARRQASASGERPGLVQRACLAGNRPGRLPWGWGRSVPCPNTGMCLRAETPAGLMSNGGRRAHERFPDLRRHCPYCWAGRGIIAARFRIPAIILLLPVGFAAGTLTTVINPDKIFGAAFSPLVSLAVAIILFDGGLDLSAKSSRATAAASCTACATWVYR